jgi:hypothetical protein
MNKGQIESALRAIESGAKRDALHGKTLGALLRRRLIWLHPSTGNPILTPGGRKILRETAPDFRSP